jgi:hypothetical protein
MMGSVGGHDVPSANEDARSATTVQPLGAERSADGVPTDQDSLTVPAQPRPILELLKGAWPVLIAAMSALATFLGLTFRLFPGLEPTPPTQVRSVTVTDLGIGERARDLGDGRAANAIYFALESVGYTANDIAVDWLIFDALTKKRISEWPTLEPWGVINFETTSDRLVGEIVVPPPADHTGCVFVRVLVRTAAVASGASDQTIPAWLLDLADTDAFDPIDPQNPDCPDTWRPHMTDA